MQKSNDRKGSKEVVENEARPTKEGQAAHRFIKDIEPFLYGRPITYVDVGAHVGTVLNTLLKSSVDVREVHLVEPNPTSFSTLQEKVAGITKVKSITCHNVAISAASGTVPMRDEGTMTHVIAPSADAPPNGISTHTFEAKTSTLDELSRLCEVDHIALLKIDVEGHELEVLEGTKHLLGTESIDIIYVEAGVNPDTTQQTYYRAIEDVLRNYGYRLFRIYEQMHEWLDDSPLLRRVNLAFMSARFVANNPYKLSRELFNLRAQKDALAEEVKGLQSAFDEQQIANQRLEQTITKLKAQLDEADANSAVEIARLQSEISRRDNTIARTTEELAALSSQLATTEIRLTSLQKERDDHAEEVATLKQNQERVEKEAQSTVKRLTSERDAFIKYSDELKAKYLRVLRSRSWRIMGPFRFVVRTVKGFMTGKPPSLNRLPKRPSLHASGRDNQGKATHRMMPLRRKPSLSERVKDVARASLPSSVKSALTVRHKAERTVQLLRKRMLDLGFVERAKAEFIEWANDDSKPYRRGLAAWELATWYLNQPSEEDARKALDYLPVATSRVSDPEIQRGAAIMTAEAYHRLGDIAKAQEVLSREVRGGEHPDFSLARSNLETTLEGKINWINRALRQCQIQEIHLRTGGPAAHPYDRLAAGEFPTMSGDDLPLISVIMPAYNSEDTIGTAIKSVLIQSWRNLEMLVVDDCSADGTAAVVEKFCRKDFRVRLIRAEVNAGPYVARNLALKEASGEFVTCHDADDWSHPQKLELQARHLLKYPNLVANHSEQARARSDLQFC